MLVMNSGAHHLLSITCPQINQFPIFFVKATYGQSHFGNILLKRRGNINPNPNPNPISLL